MNGANTGSLTVSTNTFYNAALSGTGVTSLANAALSGTMNVPGNTTLNGTLNALVGTFYTSSVNTLALSVTSSGPKLAICPQWSHIHVRFLIDHVC